MNHVGREDLSVLFVQEHVTLKVDSTARIDLLVYSAGWTLFDKNDPTRVLGRARNPIFHLALPWEMTGRTPGVVFVERLACNGDRWLFYFCGADKYVGVAVAYNH